MQNLNYTFKVNDRFLGFFLRESIFDLVTHAILTFFSDVNPLVTMRKTMKLSSKPSKKKSIFTIVEGTQNKKNGKVGRNL